jgi:hypothetical protein
MHLSGRMLDFLPVVKKQKSSKIQKANRNPALRQGAEGSVCWLEGDTAIRQDDRYLLFFVSVATFQLRTGQCDPRF